jgi:hypothetical protein
MSQVTLLLRTRLIALRHMTAASPIPPAALLALSLLAAAALLAIGHAAAPSLLAPPVATLSPGALTDAPPVRGAAALDAAFWLAVLLSSVSGFRVMDLLMRRGDIRALAPFPIALPALFADRLLVGLIEALAFGVLGALGFIPLIWHDALLVALGAGGLLVLGMIATLCVGLGVQLFFGEQAFGGPQPGRSLGNDGYGGPGSVFLYAPGVAFALSCMLLLAIKLGLGEVVRVGRWHPATSLALGAAGAICAAALITGFQSFRRAYWRMLAGFREADSVGFNVEINYQKSAWTLPRAGERLLPPAARPIYRRHVLQYGRRHALLRILYGLCWVGYAGMILRADGQAAPVWALVMAPAWLLSLLFNPWTRLLADGMATSPRQALPIASSDDQRAGWLFAAREAALITAPFILIAAALRARGVEVGPLLAQLGAMCVVAVSVWMVGGAVATTTRLRGAKLLLGPLTVAWSVAVSVVVWRVFS